MTMHTVLWYIREILDYNFTLKSLIKIKIRRKFSKKILMRKCSLLLYKAIEIQKLLNKKIIIIFQNSSLKRGVNNLLKAHLILLFNF